MRTFFLIFLLACKLTLFAQNSPLEKTIQLSDSLENRQEYARAITVWKNEKNNSKLAQSYLNYFYFIKNKTESSIHLLQKAEENLLQIKNRNAFETELLLKIYTANYNWLSEKEESKKALEKALEGVRIPDFKQAKITTQTHYLFDVSSLYRDTKNPFEAVSFGEKALRLSIQKNGEMNDEVAEYYDFLGNVYTESYNPTKGNNYYQKAITIWENLYRNNPENGDKLLTSYRNLMYVLLEYGDFENAKKINKKQNIVFFEQYKKLKNRTKNTYFHSRQMQIDCNVRLHSAIGESKKATQYCDSLKVETSLKKENIEDIEFYVMRYYDVLDYTYEYEKYQETIDRCHQLEKVIEKFDLAFPKMLINAKMGTSYEKIKNYKKALHHIKIAETVVDKENFNSSKFSIQIIKAIILSGLHKNKEALSLGKKTLEQIVYEKTKNKVDLNQIIYENVSDLAASYFINIFEKVADLYIKEYESTKDSKALEIAENLYTISGKLFQKYYIKGEFNDYLSYYHLEITEGLLQCLILKKASFEQKTALLNSIENSASQHLIKEFEKKIKRSSYSKNEIHQQLISLRTELDYYLEEQTNANSKTVFHEKKIKKLQSEIKKLTEKIAITEKNFTIFNTAAFDLKSTLSHLKPNQQLIKYYVCRQYVYAVSFTNSDITIKKLANREKTQKQLTYFMSEIKKLQPNYPKNAAQLYTTLFPFTLQKNLTIIPDSFLNYLPFESLFNPKTNQFAVENHWISYDYSLPMWELHQQYKSTKSKQNIALFSPLYTASKTDDRRSDFKDLKFARLESQKITALFDGKLFEKEKATKSNFIREKENFDIFHLAMHSQLFEDDFNKSCLLFANNEKLFFSDLYGMNIPASMVALSACDTGNGTLKNGEGIMSMSRALAYAGVKSAVVSLWKVPDRETSEIMISFYENLKKGQVKDEALANAKTIFIQNNPMKNHPYYWAGFIVNGDLSAVANNSFTWIVYAGITLIAMLLFVFRKKLFQFRK